MGRELNAQVVAAFGRQYLVETDSGEILRCVPRGKRSNVACGDRVRIETTGAKEGVIETIEPRSSLFMRAAGHRQKIIAANVTQVVVVVAGVPSFSDELIARALVAAEQQHLRSVIALNKADLVEETAAARERLKPFELAGYRVLELSAKRSVAPLVDVLEGHTTVLLGQSGMGKSTIVNTIVPDADAATQEISTFLDSGRHTTTHARLYRLGPDTALIDCPGLQEFGLTHLTADEIERGFVELHPYLGQCRFRDCRHRSEPDCAVRAAVERGLIAPRRLQLLHRILDNPAGSA
ncbi:MAG: ribosome small subunit-dependent GTPase A [Pseudomonadota bacterium]|nr:MAG: ribosome small subunit-dependent GTPase A [Pseudomonadota bacterium]